MRQTFIQLLAQTRTQIHEIGVEALKEALAGDNPPTLIDIRERDEYEAGALDGAVHLTRGFLEPHIEQVAPSRDSPIVIYCASGVRSALAAHAVQALGYTAAASLAGGFAVWKNSGFPYTVPRTLSDEKRLRYSRHVLLPEVGEEGQLRLLEARVLVLGAGGLGSPAALYLAAAGVGTLGIVDFDRVEASNLQRQIIHSIGRLGQLKTASARETINGLNPDVRVVEHRERLTADNVMELISDYDVVVDGTDNFPTRYILNDASVLLGKPVVHGSIYRFDGQVTVFAPGRGPCYRCLFPAPPPAELAPSCVEAGVLGVLPGIIGSLQATETIKLILSIGEPLIGRLVLYDALDATFRNLHVQRDSTCPVCGDYPTIASIEDIAFACSAS